MLTAAALIIFIIEAYLPPLAPIPGIKLGLANVITLFTLIAVGRKEAFTVMALRVVLGSIFTGSMMSFIYSAAGALLCFGVMLTALIFMNESLLWCVSVLGAIGHNIGQMAAAVIVTGTTAILWYLPVLMISAVITGLFTGLTAQSVLKHGGGIIKKMINK